MATINQLLLALAVQPEEVVLAYLLLATAALLACIALAIIAVRRWLAWQKPLR